MASRCLAELCANWTGDGCACRVFGTDPVRADDGMDGPPRVPTDCARDTVLLVCITCGHPPREHDLSDGLATCPGLS